MIKAFIGSEAAAEAGLLKPKQGIPGGSGLIDSNAEIVETIKANEGAKRHGVMVALMLAPEAASALAVDGGEPAADLHITLAYLGKQDELPVDVEDRAARAVSAATKDAAVLVGKVSGVGRFNGSSSSDDKDVFYASFDAPALSELREKLIVELEKEGVPVKKNHGFTPHITLAYINRDAESPIQKLENLGMTFKSVALVVGNKLRKSFMLVEKSEAPVAEPASKKAKIEKCYGYGAGYEIGSHYHKLIREKAKTADDGSHYHWFIAPNGMWFMTYSHDGSHEHQLASADSDSFVMSGAHKHVVQLPDGTIAETEIDGEHTHEAQLSETAVSGSHAHALKLKDGTVIRSVDVKALWQQEMEYREREAQYSKAVMKSAGAHEQTAEKYEVALQVPILKADEDKRLVTGIVLEPDEVDAHNDTIPADVIEKAAYSFLARYNRGTRLGVMHKIFGEIGIELVESFIAREDTEMGGQPVKKGSWLMTVKILEDSMWQKVKNGEITGFSIGGVATVIGS